MSNKENPVNRYKKMTKPASRSNGTQNSRTRAASSKAKGAKASRASTTPNNNRTQNQNTQNFSSTVEKKGISSGQIMIIALLSLLLISLLALVLFLFQPGKMQLWDKTAEEQGGAVVHRLDPILEETALKPEPKAIEQVKQAENPTEEENSSNSRDARIYFVKVNAEGQISLKSVTRSVDFSNSPLTQTINTLISGPGSNDINKGSLSLIPEGSRLLSARVEGGTAYLNFNEAFRFNPLGREGYLAQLKQIVYTSTEFPNIKNVQILIEGVIREYLGGEGFYIGEPLSRESFQNTP
jgi:germination protein M